jgi:hypothetical protein
MFKIVIAAEKDVIGMNLTYRSTGFEIHEWNWGIKTKNIWTANIVDESVHNYTRIGWAKRNNLWNWKPSLGVH